MRALLVVLVLGLPAAAAAAESARVAFTWTPGQIELGVRVNGERATFLLDTGSEYSVVSTRLAARLRLETARERTRDFADEVAIEVGPLTLRHQRVMVMPFDSYYARGRAIDGLIGYDLFARFTVAIDFRARMLTIWEPSAFHPPRGAVVVPVVFAGRLPVVESVLVGADRQALPARLMVDTGASQAVILRYPFAHEHGLLDLPAARGTTAPSLADGPLSLVEVPVEHVTVAEWTFERPRVLAHAEPRGSGASTATDGLIGNTLLSRFTLFVDYPRRRLLLRPVRH